jgi:DNA invertase Pin-like site-specific DNA recombinase
MKRTALYLRASSRDQIQHGFSIPDQLARLRGVARAAGERVVAEFIEQARSGTNAAKRSDYQNLLAAARRHEFDRVRFESVDRGHRNDLERREFEQEMQTLSIEVVYSGEPEKQAPQYRKLQRGIKGVLAEWESDETSQRTYKRQRCRAEKGKWRGGHIFYGLQPDGKGWFEPEDETYPVLLWILERRAESQGHHTIAKLLNEGINLGQDTSVPPTPSVMTYRRKPYLEQQDPETADIIQLPRPLPAATWHTKTIEKICRQAADGVYAGILQWGKSYNRFNEDADGNIKTPVRVDTGRPLIPADLLARVQAVELAPGSKTEKQSAYNTFLLSLRCGLCGEAMHGYTSTKIKPSGLTYTIGRREHILPLTHD